MDAILSPAELEILAGRFKILAEPARLQILAALRDQEHNVQEICACTGLHQGNVSSHLRLMRDAGVVACRREGIWRYYRVIDTELLALCPHLQPSPHPLEDQKQ
jgi:DNA-binding transcriptional ArsR family regulator